MISFSVCPALAQNAAQNPANDASKQQMKITAAQWKAAAAAFKKIREQREAAAAAASDKGYAGTDGGAALAGPYLGPAALIVDPVSQYYIPDYFSTPNWANSPPLAKFVDPLPQLYISGVSAPPGAGTQYIPVAVPDKLTYPDADYYEIELDEYTEVMHSQMPNGTKLRGYRQTNTADANVSAFHYLGPMIIATKGRPVRVKFTNNAPTGDHFLPVDTTGAGDAASSRRPVSMDQRRHRASMDGARRRHHHGLSEGRQRCIRSGYVV
jgi:hypothetical protein